MNVLMIIPARSKSRRLPNKNILKLGGKPLLCWSLDAALKASDQLKAHKCLTILDTDSEEYVKIAEDYLKKTRPGFGIDANEIAPYLRPPHLSDDVATGLVIENAHRMMIELYGFDADIVVTLQPTSPFRYWSNICFMIDLLRTRALKYCIFTAKRIKEFPQWAFTEDGELWLGYPPEMLSGLIAQNLPKLYLPDGAIYITKKHRIRGLYGFAHENMLLPVEDKIANLDIEEQFDFDFAQWLVETGRVKLN